MIKLLMDEESEKLNDPLYPGGGYDPPYGPALTMSQKNSSSDRYAYFKILKNEYIRLTYMDQIDQLWVKIT